MGPAGMNGALRDLGEFVRRHEGGWTDGQLLESFLSRRDESAFTMLVRRHGPMVLGVCRRVLGHEQDAEDAFQATFLVLARKAAGIVPREAAGAWLYGVAYRTARKAQTMTARRRLKEQQARDARRSAAAPEETCEELQPALDEELSRLPEMYRAAIVLCDLQGNTKKEAAARLGCPEGTLSSRLTRGRRLLAERLTRRGVTLPAGALVVMLSQSPASVRAGLTVSTGRAAALLATGPVVGAVSARVAALTEAVLKAMLLSNLKFAVAVLAVAGVLGATAAFLAHPAQAAGPADAKAAKAAPDAKPAAPTLTDRHGDPLPAGAVTRLGTVRLRHKNTSGQTFVFSPDGKTLFTGGNDGKIRLWEVATGKPLRTLERQGAEWGEFDTPNALALCPAGKVLAAAWGRRGLHLWDVETGKEVGALREPVYSLAFTPDGRNLFCGGGDGAIRVWDVAAAKERRRVLWQKGSINDLVCLPDGRTLVATAFSGLGGLTLQVGDPLADGERGSFVRGRYPPLSFSPDGKVLAVEGIKPASVRLLDVMTGKEVSRFTGHRNGVLGAAISPDGKTIASVGYDETIRWWDRASGKELRKATWREPPAYLQGTRIRLAFSPDGKTLVSAGGDSTLRLWDVATGTQRQGPEGHEGGIESVAASPDGRTLVSCSFDDHTARLWDSATGRPLHLLRHRDYVRRAVFSPDGKQVISGGGEGAIRVWDAATGKEIRSLQLADPAKVEERQQVSNLALASDGKRVVVVSGGFTPKELSYRLTTWDWASGKRLNQRELPDGFDGAFPGDGSLVARLVGAGIVVENVGTGKVALRLDVPAGANGFWYPLVFSPSRRLLATVTVTRNRDGKGRRSAFTVRVWETASGREVWSRPTPCWGRVMAFSPDGKRLAWAGADIFAVHDAATGRELLRREGFDGSVYALAFLPGGTRLATGLDNGTVLVWDVSRATGKPAP